MKIYKQIVMCLNSINFHEKRKVTPDEKYFNILKDIEKNYLPSGSGFDSGSEILDGNDSKYVIKSAFHVMNENGYYVGWIHFKVTVKASLTNDFDIDVKGNFSDFRKDSYGLKDYIIDTFDYVLNQEYKEKEN